MNKEELLNKLRNNETKKILNNIGIKHLYLVGSYSRGDYTEDSDIDLIYERDESKEVSFLALVRYKDILRDMLGKNIDLVNEKYVYNSLKKYIEKDKILIY